MPERCGFCGRFMRQVWWQTNDHEDSWECDWKCRPECEERYRALGMALTTDREIRSKEGGGQ